VANLTADLEPDGEPAFVFPGASSCGLRSCLSPRKAYPLSTATPRMTA